MLETMRILKVLNSKALVVSEIGKDPYLAEKWKEVVNFATYGEDFGIENACCIKI